jgi:hypothetical protein
MHLSDMNCDINDTTAIKAMNKQKPTKTKWSKRENAEMLKELRIQRAMLSKLRKKVVQVKNRKLTRNEARAQTLDYMKRHLTEAQYNFLESQLENSNKKPNGFRYSEESKITALTLFYKSPRVYNFMRQLFTLPSRQTLMSFLAQQKIGEGFNPYIFRALEAASKKLEDRENLVSLTVDAINLSPELNYNDDRGNVIGLDKESKNPATQALVIMMRGIYTSYKQPLYYSFHDSKFSGPQLKLIMESCIDKVTACGFKVKNIICDQCGANQNLFTNYFHVSEEKPYFVRNGTKIYCLYD